MSDSLRDLLRKGADTVEKPDLDVPVLVARTHRRLVRRRLVAVATGAAVVLVAAGGLALRPGDARLAPAPPATTETETPTGTPSDLVYDLDERYVPVPPGTHAVAFSGWGDVPPEVADLRAVVTFPAGFTNRVNSTFVEQGTSANPGDLGFWTARKVPSNFCSNGSVRSFTDPGPTVEDLATALAALPRLAGTNPRPVTIGGHDGMYVELTRPLSDCSGVILWLAPRVFHRAYEDQFRFPGDVARIWILDVDGVRVVIDVIHAADASDDDVEEIVRMVETATFMTVD